MKVYSHTDNYEDISEYIMDLADWLPRWRAISQPIYSASKKSLDSAAVRHFAIVWWECVSTFLWGKAGYCVKEGWWELPHREQISIR